MTGRRFLPKQRATLLEWLASDPKRILYESILGRQSESSLVAGATLIRGLCYDTGTYTIQGKGIRRKTFLL